jgi:hypothetical protein
VAKDEDRDELAYSLPAKLLILATVPVMAGLGTFSIWFVMTYWSSGPTLGVVFGVMGAWFFYIAYLGLRLVTFLNARVVVSDRGLELLRSGGPRLLTWGEFGTVRHDGLHHVLTVRDRSGQLFLMVDTKVSGFRGLPAVLEQWKRT